LAVFDVAADTRCPNGRLDESSANSRLTCARQGH
jgi:hypothetical protein